ncbi:MAG: zinc metallopeptidase [Bacilli bacterium]|nr:zinc metallopeptidase [Bacilli bacterium]
MDLILILIIIFLPLIASFYIKINYNKYIKVKTSNNLTGFEVARKILDKHNLKDVHIVKTNGTMSDHYDSSRKVVRLSSDVFDGTTIAANAIAAHEVGHAIQDKEGYFFLKLRGFIFPVVKIASSIAYYIIFIGFLLELMDLARLGILLVSLGLLFQIITLPVEFNASKRAKQELENNNLLNQDEIRGTKKMLLSAAFTYVAGVLASALQLLRLILITNNRD